jgi:hypothetical protein
MRIPSSPEPLYNNSASCKEFLFANAAASEDQQRLRAKTSPERARQEQLFWHTSSMQDLLPFAVVKSPSIHYTADSQHFLAMTASVFAFLRKPVAAGILSLIVAATTGIPRTLPLARRANFYRTLHCQTFALLTETQLIDKITVSGYNSRIRQLTTIFSYEQNLPAIEDEGAVTQEILGQAIEKEASK